MKTPLHELCELDAFASIVGRRLLYSLPRPLHEPTRIHFPPLCPLLSSDDLMRFPRRDEKWGFLPLAWFLSIGVPPPSNKSRNPRLFLFGVVWISDLYFRLGILKGAMVFRDYLSLFSPVPPFFDPSWPDGAEDGGWKWVGTDLAPGCA